MTKDTKTKRYYYYCWRCSGRVSFDVDKPCKKCGAVQGKE